MNFSVDTDGRTVWVNSETHCVGRCCPVSFEIINPSTGQMENYRPDGKELYNMKSDDYSLFVKRIAEYYDLTLTCECPKWAK